MEEELTDEKLDFMLHTVNTVADLVLHQQCQGKRLINTGGVLISDGSKKIHPDHGDVFGSVLFSGLLIESKLKIII